MLILLSDLHLMDGTAGVHHLTIGAVREAFDDLAKIANKAKPKDIKIVLLGDIFDLIRTERWFSVPPEHRPWGSAPSEEAAMNILEGVIANNKESFELMAGSLADVFGFPAEPEIVFVPGNHDRLCNMYPSLRRRVREVFGMPPSDAPFDHQYLDLDHGVLGRHGQEWDAFNFEGSETFRLQEYSPIPLEDYFRVPIGDLLACEVASRMPGAVRDALGENHPQRDLLYRRFQDLFDVRPMMAIMEWLNYQADRNDETVQKAVNEAVRQVGHEFQDIPFVPDWINRHDQARNPFDEGDVLQMLLFIMDSIKFTRFDRSLRTVEGAEKNQEDKFALKAVEDFRRLDANPDLKGGILYAIYGHTHQADQRAVGVVGEGSKERYRMYLNTGTWRPVQRHGLSGHGFVNWMNITYTVVCKAGEANWGGRIETYPAFQTWTGALRDV